jgi:hypothetical protein
VAINGVRKAVRTNSTDRPITLFAGEKCSRAASKV